MFNFNVGFLQGLRSFEIRNCEGQIWFLKDMSVDPTVFRKEYPLLVLDPP